MADATDQWRSGRPNQMINPDAPIRDQICIPTPVLYRCFAVDGTLLYIGMTTQPAGRFSNHRRKTPWWPAVERISMHSYRNLHSLKQAEIKAIWVEKPWFNIIGKKTYAMLIKPGERLGNDAAAFATHGIGEDIC